MQWIILEALVALALGLLIVWLALSPVRKRERKEDADSDRRDEADRNDG